MSKKAMVYGPATLERVDTSNAKAYNISGHIR
ncbi:hypothetical protein J2Z79_001692 [Symbiobacterium terraclitae]|uniref:Uncharacterized protein n=1 Tax=Symbiobacterium terraclitae TaxID=557451 RepID=A0ABS4JTH1_9FIRM|nr:hypothetical protein [Symbiobacterium terraclitae]